MIEAILPECVSVVEVFGVPEEAELNSLEAITMGGAVDSRRREFAAGRRCARRAMARFGLGHVAIPRGENREPVWPENIVGSITHTKGYCAAAVSIDSELRSLGIDAEPAGPLPKGVLDKVSTVAEREHLAGLPPGVDWDRILFSAKESIYKALWPSVRQWIGFSDAEIRFGADSGRFAAIVTAPVGVAIEGRFLAAGGFVMTAVALGRET